MNQITNVPAKVSDAGYKFNYALWTAGTVVTLVNVPWDSDYRNIIAKSTSIDSYIDRQVDKLVVNNMKHMRLNQPVKIDAPFEVASQYNYIRATNPAQPVPGSMPSTYYYFIKNVEYGAPNTTILNVQLDVWATFRNNVVFNRAYVERGHIGIANENQMVNNGREYLTVPEGLDLGGEMEIAHTGKYRVATARGKEGSSHGNMYAIMVTTSVDLETPPGDENNAKIITATGSRLENLPNGGGIYIFPSPVELRQFLNHYKDKAWITQGITSIIAIPPIISMQLATEPASIEGVSSALKVKPGTIPQRTEKLVSDWAQKMNLPSRYKHLHKFKTYPYSVIELTMYNGQPLIMKPESMASKDVNATVIYHLNPGSGKIVVVPQRYNARSGAETIEDEVGITDDGGEWLDFSTSLQNFPTFSTVNNSYSAYMAANRNQIAYQQQSASWDQQRALMGANTAASQASSGIEMANSMNAAKIQQNNATMRLNDQTLGMRGAVGLGQTVVGTAGNMARGGGVGAAVEGAANAGAGFANMMIDMHQNVQGTNISNAYANQTTAAQVKNQGFIRDSNLSYAQQAAQGDYANAIAGVQAKVQDARMLQPTTSGQIGGDAFNLAAVDWAIITKIKRISPLAMTEVGEYWLRYGYRVNRWVHLPDDLLVCAQFTYWQTKDTNVLADGCPEEYRMTIRGILEKGVTVYRSPDAIGTVDPANNSPLEGIKY